MDVNVEEDVLNQASFFVADDIMEEYFGIRFDAADSTEDLSASGDAQADADYEEMMRSLGMSELDFETEEKDRDKDGEKEEDDQL